MNDPLDTTPQQTADEIIAQEFDMKVKFPTVKSPQNTPQDPQTKFSTISTTTILKTAYPPIEWLIEPLIPKEGFTFLYGESGTGKSYLSLAIAQAVADATPLFDQFGSPEPNNVLIMDKENAFPLIQQRLINFNLTSNNIWYLNNPELFNLVDSKNQLTPEALHAGEFVKQKNINLIIIDSFVDFMMGNENSPEDTQYFFNTMRLLFPNKAVLVLHHENKPSQGVIRSSANKIRGSSNLNAQTTSQIRVENIIDDETNLMVEQTKSRYKAKYPKFQIKMMIEEEQLIGFEYLGVVVGDTEKSGQAKKIIEDALLNKAEMTRQEIMALCMTADISNITVRRALKELEDEKIIGSIENPNDKRKLIYFIKNPGNY